MASLIERLVGDQVVRTDQKRIMPVRRPLPERPRDVLDIFSAMGGEASMSILTQSLDIKAATPGWMSLGFRQIALPCCLGSCVWSHADVITSVGRQNVCRIMQVFYWRWGVDVTRRQYHHAGAQRPLRHDF